MAKYLSEKKKKTFQVSFLYALNDVGGLTFLWKNRRVFFFFHVTLGFHLASLWIPIQVFNWLKPASFLPVSPGDPGTKRTSSRSQVRWNRTGLCSLIFTTSLGLCRGGQGGRSERPHQETAHSSTAAATLRPNCTGEKEKKRKKLFKGNSKKINVIFTHETEMRNAPARLLIVRLWRLCQFDIDW